jgi:hypothetical protein
MSPPVNTSAERSATIERARTIRNEMADVRARLARGSLLLTDALSNPNPDAAVNRLYVVKLLESLPEIGKIRARRVMGDIGIAEKCRVLELKSNQRSMLITKLGQ